MSPRDAIKLSIFVLIIILVIGGFIHSFFANYLTQVQDSLKESVESTNNDFFFNPDEAIWFARKFPCLNSKCKQDMHEWVNVAMEKFTNEWKEEVVDHRKKFKENRENLIETIWIPLNPLESVKVEEEWYRMSKKPKESKYSSEILIFNGNYRVIFHDNLAYLKSVYSGSYDGMYLLLRGLWMYNVPPSLALWEIADMDVALTSEICNGIRKLFQPIPPIYSEIIENKANELIKNDWEDNSNSVNMVISDYEEVSFKRVPHPSVVLFEVYLTLSTQNIARYQLLFYPRPRIRLQRGHIWIPTNVEERNPVLDLVFVVHGIGHHHGEEDIVSNTKDIKDGFSLYAKKFYKTRSLPTFIPIAWRYNLTLNDELIKNLSTARNGSFAQEATTIVNDVIYYANSKIFSPKIIEKAFQEMNRKYSIFLKYDLKENKGQFQERGRVSILAHSLGSVLAYDILKDHAKSINFNNKVKNLFIIGSPLGLFLAHANMTQQDILQNDFIKQGRIFNIRHPQDPIAYRLEPIFPNITGNHEQFLLSKSSALNYLKNALSDLYNRPGLEILNENESHRDKMNAPKGIDYALEDIPIDRIDLLTLLQTYPIYYIKLLNDIGKAHSSYWNKNEVTELMAQIIYESPPSSPEVTTSKTNTQTENLSNFEVSKMVLQLISVESLSLFAIMFLSTTIFTPKNIDPTENDIDGLLIFLNIIIVLYTSFCYFVTEYILGLTGVLLWMSVILLFFILVVGPFGVLIYLQIDKSLITFLGFIYFVWLYFYLESVSYFYYAKIIDNVVLILYIVARMTYYVGKISIWLPFVILFLVFFKDLRYKIFGRTIHDYDPAKLGLGYGILVVFSLNSVLWSLFSEKLIRLIEAHESVKFQVVFMKFSLHFLTASIFLMISHDNVDILEIRNIVLFIIYVFFLSLAFYFKFNYLIWILSLCGLVFLLFSKKLGPILGFLQFFFLMLNLVIVALSLFRINILLYDIGMSAEIRLGLFLALIFLIIFPGSFHILSSYMHNKMSIDMIPQFTHSVAIGSLIINLVIFLMFYGSSEIVTKFFGY